VEDLVSNGQLQPESVVQLEGVESNGGPWRILQILIVFDDALNIPYRNFFLPRRYLYCIWFQF
jgi:hypothetical protein